MIDPQRLPMVVKVAQIRLAYSLMPIARVYSRGAQEMVFDAHDKAFAFYLGVCRRGIYDNMKTAVETVFVGRAREYNQRFLQLRSYHLVEPVACTPTAGWEKGSVGAVRALLFRPQPREKMLYELNAWLADQCVAHAQRAKHPEFRDRSVIEVFEAEKARLMPYLGPFAGFVERPMRATTTCLITHDRNEYSADARAAGRAVLVRAYAERRFKRDQVAYDPWHYPPMLIRKPGALRNGAPFKDWDLPPPLTAMREKLRRHADGDRQFVKILGRAPERGIAAVAEACTEALAAGIASGDVVMAILARRRQPPVTASITTLDALRLKNESVVDCARYDNLLLPASRIRAELTHRQSRSSNYRISGARQPPTTDLR